MDDEYFREWLSLTFSNGPDHNGDPTIRIMGGIVPYYIRTLNREQACMLLDHLKSLLPDRDCMCGTPEPVEYHHVAGCPVRVVGGEG